MKFNDSSITASWTSPRESELNGMLRWYKIEVYEQLDSGYLRMVANKTVPAAVSVKTFDSLKTKTEYIIEVRAGTVAGFGPPTVVHQRTSGEGER